MAFSLGNSTTAAKLATTNYGGTLDNNKDAVVAIVSIRHATATVSDTPTYGGQAMTLADTQFNSTDSVRLYIYVLPNAPTGSQTFACTVTSAVAGRVTLIAVGGGSLTSSLLGATAKANNATVNLTPQGNDSMLIAGIITEDGSAPTAGAGETAIPSTLIDEGTWATGAEYVIKTGGAGVAHTMNFGGPSTDSAIVAIELKLATGTATNSERSAVMTGKTTANSERSATLTGKATSNSERSAVMTGKTTANSERPAVVTGKATSNSERGAILTGESTSAAQTERSAVTTGKAAASSERSATTLGKATANSERGATLIGGVASDRPAHLYGGYEFTVSDDFSTTDNKDAVNTTADWSGDGEITL